MESVIRFHPGMNRPATPRKRQRHAKLLLGTLSLALAATAGAKNFLVYFGTYTNALSQGIYVSRLDAATGNLSDPELAAETPNPCWVTISPDKKFLYATASINSFKGENTGAVSAFAIDSQTGRLTLVDEKSSGGVDPCHASVDASGKVLFVANYGDGTVKSFLLAPNGTIGADGTFSQHIGHGPNADRQAGPHAHFIATDPSNRFALACDLGLDKVVVYALNPNSGALELKSDFSRPTVPPGSGSRHLAFSRDGRFVHVVNEMGCTVTTLAWDSETGTLTPIETVSALPSDLPLQKRYTAAEIVVHPSGKYVYVSLRGPDSVSVFKASAHTGKLTLVQNIPSGGKVPRGLGIDPTGHWLITGNQKSDNAVEYAIDTKTGKLSPTGRELKIGSPVDVKFLPVD